MNYTIKEIAEKAGVSKTTVSLVINGKARASRINPETEKKILDVIQKYSFSPNKLARSFRTNKSDTIGLIIPDVRNPFFSNLSHSLEQILKQNGYQMLIGCSDDQMDIESKVMQNLISYSIDGLIVASAADSQAIINRIDNLNIPAVFIDREIDSQKYSSVSSANKKGAFDAINYLCSLGVKEIYHIGGLEKLPTTQERLDGYIEALKHNGLEIDRSKIILRDYQRVSGYEMMKKIYTTKKALPEAIFTGSYTILEGCLKFIHEQFKAIPGSLRIVTFDDHPLLDFLSNNIISVQQDTDALAKSAFELINKKLNGSDEVEHPKIMPKLIIRD